MNIPGIGELTPQDGDYVSEPIEVPMFYENEFSIVLMGYDDDDRPEEFHTAVANLLAGTPSVIEAAQEAIFQYYQDMNSQREPSDDDYLVIDSADDVWDHIEFGDELDVWRGDTGDQPVYISIECECDWEPEHGLEIVIRNGERVVKIGMADGHPEDIEENAVYKSFR